MLSVVPPNEKGSGGALSACSRYTHQIGSIKRRDAARRQALLATGCVDRGERVGRRTDVECQGVRSASASGRAEHVDIRYSHARRYRPR